ncbi:MAG: hypothetical protein QME51_09185 [Planctomycetota bacterium]|nr:hypothetical protein [Planctomycetota bacterium]
MWHLPAAGREVIPLGLYALRSMPYGLNSQSEIRNYFSCFLHSSLTRCYGAIGASYSELDPAEWRGTT